MFRNHNCSTEYALATKRSFGPLSFDPYEPEWTCEDEERVADDIHGHPRLYGDGPKFVCAPRLLSSSNKCLVYSFGSNNDLSFERGIWRLSDQKCEIHVFDPTPAGRALLLMMRADNSMALFGELACQAKEQRTCNRRKLSRSTCNNLGIQAGKLTSLRST